MACYVGSNFHVPFCSKVGKSNMHLVQASILQRPWASKSQLLSRRKEANNSSVMTPPFANRVLIQHHCAGEETHALAKLY